MKEFAGRAAIGHVRYATCGAEDHNYAQPFERQHLQKHKWFSFGFNGQLANYHELQQRAGRQRQPSRPRQPTPKSFSTTSAASFRAISRPAMVEVLRNISRRFDGAYNLVFINALGDMVVARDPLGIRPLCYAKEGPLFAAASESVALLNLGFAAKASKSLLPGQAIIITDGRLEMHTFARSPRRAHCFFEWIYFANVASTMDGRSVYLSRKRLGEEMARLETLPIDSDTIVVPVPDTSKAAADAMAYKLKVPSLEGLIRNRYTGRTFIEGGGNRKRKGRNQIHAAARSARRTTRAAGRRFDRPLDDDESAGQADSRVGPGPRDSCSRRLPADYRSLLLRHRHVDDRRTLRPAFFERRPADRRSPSGNGPATGGRFAPLSARRIDLPSDRLRQRSTLPGLHHGRIPDRLRSANSIKSPSATLARLPPGNEPTR